MPVPQLGNYTQSRAVPTALLSRVEVFNVPAPESAQRRRIINEMVGNLRSKTKRKIALDESSSEALANRIDIDLRRVTRLVHEAFTRAMQGGDKVAHIVIPVDTIAADTPYQRSTIGFQHSDTGNRSVSGRSAT
ncbi:MAG: hypothetical protein ACHP7O_05395 [Burkholderiales bacterium]